MTLEARHAPRPHAGVEATPWLGIHERNPVATRITIPEIDENTKRQFEAEVDQAIAAGDGPVVLDFSEVTYADSSTLRVLISVQADLRKNGRTLEIVKRSAAITRLLEVTGLAEHFDGT